MAIYRNPIICPHCSCSNEFKYNGMSLKKRLAGFVGDTGGHYPIKCKECKKSLTKMKSVEFTEEEKEFLKKLGSKSDV